MAGEGPAGKPVDSSCGLITVTEGSHRDRR
jgi:hypothetical protein